MEFVADFHIHSKYSRATSADMDLDHLVESAKLKGISILGTGDFTHYLWFEELRTKLKELGNGLYFYKGIHFILTTEISSIYSKNGRTRKIHNIVFSPSFEIVEKINNTLMGYGNLSADGRPILGLDAKDLVEILFGISRDIFVVPGHIWTPHFSLFGSNSGFDSIEECFEEYSKDIHCLETGLSSNPAMNWCWSKLDRFSLISNSDSHSPPKIGREANVFDTELSYNSIIDALKKKEKKRFLYTVEFFPEEGKYHYDGHRNCKMRLSPEETRKYKNICPVCKKPLTIGVMNRVESLADREEGFVPKNAVGFKSMIPLDEIIADALGLGKGSMAVEREYHSILPRVGTEFEILLKIDEGILLKELPRKIAEGIIRVRNGKVKILPGYDGEYGKIEIFGEDQKTGEKQLSLF